MSPDLANKEDGTILFLPHRLNRQPVVVRGLTADELWLCAGGSAAICLTLGLPLAWLLGSIAVVPSLIVGTSAIGIFSCGGVLRRLKRGRPETWLYRQLQWHLALRYPLLGDHLGARDLITRTGYWATRRTPRRSTP